MKKSRKRHLARLKGKAARREKEFQRAEASAQRLRDLVPRREDETADEWAGRVRDFRGRIAEAKEGVPAKLWTPPKESPVRPGMTRLPSGLIVPTSHLESK